MTDEELLGLPWEMALTRLQAGNAPYKVVYTGADGGPARVARIRLTADSVREITLVRPMIPQGMIKEIDGT